MRRTRATRSPQSARRLLVGCIVAVSGLATTITAAAELQWDRRYDAGLQQSEWTVERDDHACHLLHPLPRFGLAVFSRGAGGEQALRIYTHRPPRNSRTVELWSEPTEWRNGSLRRVGFTRALEDPRTFLLNHAMANRVLQELERGQRPVITFEDWHAPGEAVALALSNAGFRPVYQRYLDCAGNLHPTAEQSPLDPGNGTAAPVASQTGSPTVAAGVRDLVTGSRPAPPGSDVLARHGQTPPPAEAAGDAEDPANDNGRVADEGDRPVHFVFDDTGLTRTEKDHLQEFVDTLEDEHGTITVTGHTDSTGDADYNRRLGEARAAAVRDYLAGRGVDPDRITVASAGETSPSADNETAYGRAANRRASLHLER